MMHLSEDDGAASTRLAGKARELARRGPASTSPGTGPVRRLTRRLALQLLRPFAAHQQELDGRLLDAIEDLERRLGDLERLQLETLVQDFPASLEALRARVADAEDVVAGSRALPYTAPGALQEFRDP